MQKPLTTAVDGGGGGGGGGGGKWYWMDHNRYWILVILLLTLPSATNLTTLSSDGLPVHENLFFVIDVGQDYTDLVRTILSQLFDGINLLNYRIGVHTTNGVVKPITDFQSRQCTISEITRGMSTERNISRRDILKKILNKRVINSLPFKEKDCVIVVTDDDLVSRRFDYVIRIPDDISGSEIENSVLRNLHFYDGNLNKCDVEHPIKVVFDECNRECACVNGRLHNCYRVREQFSKLTLKQRLHYINVYKALFTHRAFNRTFLDLLSVHPSLEFRLLHGKEQILPFHRKYLIAIENLFRLLDCRITIPYWNFPRFSQAVYQPSQNYHIWDEYGGFGSASKTSVENGFCVQNGEFGYPGWRIPQQAENFIKNETLVVWICKNKYGYSWWLERNCRLKLNKTLNRHCLSRAVNEDRDFKVIPYEAVKKLVMRSQLKDFNKFMHRIIFEVHSPIHDKLGGLFCTGLSSFMPEFLPFHSMLDALWDKFQRRGRPYAELFLQDNKTRLLWFNERRNKYVDNKNLGECGVKVKYTEIFND